VQVTAVANQKGGSCKTTTTVNLAAGLAALGDRVLVIDLDPLASASKLLGATGEASGLPAFIYGDAELKALAEPSRLDRLDVIQSSAELAAAIRQAPPQAVNALSAGVRDLDRWDWVLMDCNADLGVLSVGALLAADSVIVPVNMSGLTLEVLPVLFKAIHDIAKQSGGLEISGILPCQVDMRQVLSRNLVKQLEDAFGDQVFRTRIRETVRHKEAATLRQTIHEYDPRGYGAEDYTDLAVELKERNS
jgi:chromosome partitioning protein